MEEIVSVRRSISAHAFHGLWALLIFYSAWRSEPPVKYIWGVLFAVSIALMLRVIIKRNYFELRGSKLTVHGEFFSTQTIEIDDIERIEIEAGPFGSSKIFLRHKRKIIRFNYANVHIKEFKILLQYLNVLVT